MRHNPFLRPSRLKSLSEAYWNTHSLNWRFAIRNGSPSCVSGTPGVKHLGPEHDHIAKDIETVRGLYASYSGVCVYMITSIMFKFIFENSTILKTQLLTTNYHFSGADYVKLCGCIGMVYTPKHGIEPIWCRGFEDRTYRTELVLGSYCWWFRNPKQPPGMYKTGCLAGFLNHQQ